MNLDKYELVVFDVDGTLYYQKKLRMIMAGRLMGYYICHPHKIRDLLIIKDFRNLRDRAEDVTGLYELTARKNKCSIQRVESVIKKWIYENPMDAVARSKDERLLDMISGLGKSGKTIAVWSDYEADDKLKALGLECAHVYTAEQERVGELKPSPKGLKLIMSDLSIEKEKTLMIGDRQIKDGEAAKSAGVDYLILSSKKRARNRQLDTLYFDIK